MTSPVPAHLERFSANSVKTPEEWQAIRDRTEENMRKSREHSRLVDKTWASPEVAAIGKVVREDGNVDWRQFVAHVGGILKVAELVDGNGDPDTERIIALVDDLFNEHADREVAMGSVFRRRPGNRPYKPQRAVQPHAFPGDNERAPREPGAAAPGLRTR